MSAKHHTLGPWTVEIEADCNDHQADIYVCHEGTVCDVTVICTMGTSAYVSPDQKLADAYLCAAAPELRYVAQCVTELAEVLGENNAVVRLAQAALDKAKAPSNVS